MSAEQALHPSHEWYESSAEKGVMLCDVCGLCACHSPKSAALPCDPEADID